jgi:hypothetical protein
MKELYEVRSSMAHRGPKADFSQNWKEWQHMVVAAFAYPFAVKLKLAAAGLYQLKDREVGACRALDRLLDSHWGQGWRKDPEWPTILSQSEYEPAWDKFIRQAMEEVETGVKSRRRTRSSGVKAGPGYD